MSYFPPPPELPAKTRLFRRVPPAIFPAMLGLLGLVTAWQRAVSVFGLPQAIVDLASGMVTLLFIFSAMAYALKLILRFGALFEDVATLPGRTGVSALCLGMIVLAVNMARVSQSVASVLLLAGSAGLLALALYVLPQRLRGTDTAGPLTPAIHLVFVGFIVIPGAAMPLGLMVPAMPWLIFYCMVVAFGLTALTVRPLILGGLAPPLRPLQAIQLAPPAFVAIGSILTGQSTLAALALIWATGVACVLLVRMRWLTEGPFSGFWSAFTFPVTAYAGSLLLAYDAFGWSAARIAGGVVLVAATLYIPVIAVKILKLWAEGSLAVKTNASTA